MRLTACFAIAMYMGALGHEPLLEVVHVSECDHHHDDAPADDAPEHDHDHHDHDCALCAAVAIADAPSGISAFTLPHTPSDAIVNVTSPRIAEAHALLPALRGPPSVAV